MGVLKSITEKQKTTDAESPSAGSIQPPGRDPAPCESCGGPFFWLDAYHVARCCDCEPAPSRRMVRWPLLGVAGPPGGPWWWETVEDEPVRFRVPAVGDVAKGEPGAPDGDDALRLVEHEYHGRRIVSVVGRDSVVWSRDSAAKCMVFCSWDRPARKWKGML